MKPIDTKNPLCRGGYRLQVFRAPSKYHTSKNPLLQAGCICYYDFASSKRTDVLKNSAASSMAESSSSTTNS